MQFLNVPPELQSCFRIENGLVRWNLNADNVSKLVVKMQSRRHYQRLSCKILLSDSVYNLYCIYCANHDCADRQLIDFYHLSRIYDNIKIKPINYGFCTYTPAPVSHVNYNKRKYKINDITACIDCYNNFTKARECFKSVILESAIHAFEITNTDYNLDYFVVDDNKGVCLLNRLNYDVESIELYHPKLFKFGKENNKKTCHICYKHECNCETYSKQIFVSFYFGKYKLGLNFDIPKDIIGVIFEMLMNVCMNYNYTDTKLLKIDEKMFVVDEFSDY